MNRSIRGWSASILFFVAAMNAATQMVKASENESDIKAVASLSEALSIEDVLVLLDQYQVRPLMLESDFQIGEENIHDFYLDLAGKSADEIKAGYEDSRRTFLEDMLRLNAAATVFPDYVRSQQHEMQNALRMGDYREIQISKVMVKGRSHDVERFVLGESLKSGSDESSLDKDSRRNINESATVADSTWYPNSGTSQTGESSTSERYVMQLMKWTNVSFGAEETYEHDFSLYNYDNDGTYFTMDTNFYPDCLPAVAYASTTWPADAKPYLDTRFDGLRCENEEPAYTMGAARANALASGTTYQTYMRLRNGNVAQDKFKLWAQRGHRSPSWCDDTWCSYSDEFEILVPSWNNAVPGIVNWSKPAPSLSVSLSASPSNGPAPLNDVSLTASVGGTATGTINYTFYCNRADEGTNITSPWAAKYDGVSTNPKTVANICDYASPGTYTAKVIAERGTKAAEARKTITVGTSSSPVPEVTTLAATSVTQTSATFNATVHPKNSATTFWFDYGTTASVSQPTSTQALAAATSPSSVSISQGGLSCGQQYYFRIRASNAGGPATPGSILSFTTDACGGGGSQSVQLVADPSFEAGNNAWWVANPAFYIKGTPTFPNPHTGSKYAFLSNSDGSKGNNLTGGMISPSVTIPEDATDADLRFYYSITSDETTSTQVYDKVDVYLVRPGNQLNLITTISNLNENGTSYSLKSTDLSSSFYGDTVQIFFAGSTDGSFPTVFRIDDVALDVDLPSESAPTVTTETADQVNASSARLNMTVNPHGANTEVWFDLEAGDSTPNDDTQHISVGAGSQNESVSIAVFDLQCDTLYYFQAEASNSEGSDSGTVRSFTTSACAGSAPDADTDPAENITQSSATLTADVTANGLSTQAWFAWGTTSNLGQETPHMSVGSGSGSVDFAQTLSGLNCGTTYFFENRAANSAGQDDGATLEFTTASCDTPPSYPINVTTGTADSITETSAVLHGSANPNGAPSSGFFAYGIFPNLDYTFGVPLGSSRADQQFSILVTGLSCGSEYFFDAVANNSYGESNGGAKFFRTLDCGTSSPTSFYTLTPCRLVDTRNPSDPNGPAITENEGRIVVLAGKCGIPPTAKAVSFNVTVVNPSAAGYLSLYPASAAPPSTSTISFRQGQVRGNNGIVGLRFGGVTVFGGLASVGSVDFVIDVNGYFE